MIDPKGHSFDHQFSVAAIFEPAVLATGKKLKEGKNRAEKMEKAKHSRGVKD